MTYDDPNPHTRNTRAKPVKVTANPEHVIALEMQLDRLKRMEESDKTYQEMMQKVTERVTGR